MKKQAFIFYPFLLVLLLLLFAGGLVYGAVSIPVESVVNILLGEGTERLAWQNIVLQSRFPQAVTALLAGASLAVSGLLLQTLFRNPLAGPSILGISDGANLGVAAIMLYFGGSLSMVTDLPISGYLAVIMAAFSGAACILGLIIYFSPTFTITKWPALRERAIKGASTSSFTTLAEKCSLLTILFIIIATIDS